MTATWRDAVDSRRTDDHWSPDVRALNIVGPRWALLILRDLMAGPRRHKDLSDRIPHELLRQRLAELVRDGLITKTRHSARRVEYELTDAGLAVAPVLAEIARWGYRNCWGEPVDGEAVDIAAVLRLARGLVVGMPDGRVLASVHQPQHIDRFLVVSARGRVAVTEVADPPGRLDSQVAGGEREWVAFLAPGHRVDALRIVGDRPLALAMLEILVARNSAK